MIGLGIRGITEVERKGEGLRLETSFDESRQHALRESIARLVRRKEVVPPSAVVDAIVSHIEVCDAHGTGLLTQLVFGGETGIVSIRSRDQHGGSQEFGDRAARVRHPPRDRRAIASALLRVLDGCDVRRIVCIPYFQEDVANALCLVDLFGAPLCTFVMDDNNIETREVPDALLRELFARSALRLAISPELRDAYEGKFGLRFWFVPPLVAPDVVCRAPPEVPDAETLGRRRGTIIGNIWSREWLERLRHSVRGTGVTLDWFSNGDIRALGVSEKDLAADGIFARGFVPQKELVAALRRTSFAVVPSGTLDERDTRRGIARFSLPSRIAYLLAVSHTPVVVLGHPDTAAARFVRAHGVGMWAPYEPGAFVAAVAAVGDPSRQAAMRAEAARLGPVFSSEGARDWIWRSLDQGGPVDDRWERLVSERSR